MEHDGSGGMGSDSALHEAFARGAESDPEVTDQIGITAPAEGASTTEAFRLWEDPTAPAAGNNVTFELSLRPTVGDALRPGPRGLDYAIPRAGTGSASDGGPSFDPKVNPWSLGTQSNPWHKDDHGVHPRACVSLGSRPYLLAARSPEPHVSTWPPSNSEPQTNELPAHRSEPQIRELPQRVPEPDTKRIPARRPEFQADRSDGVRHDGDRQRGPWQGSPGLQLQPMVHVDDMAATLSFYAGLGAEIVHGDRDSDWVLLQLGTTQIGLLARPPDPARGECTVELNFAASMPLDELEEKLRRDGVTIVDIAARRDFGAQLHVRTPDGLLIKISQLEPDLPT
jgi:catechol 2,3-dioxygenase-like lactoylglutathione lyase family enzyme